MTEILNNTINNSSDEISLKEIIEKILEWWKYLKTKWIKLVFISFIGGIIGFLYAWMQPTTYTAKLTFVVEDGKSGGSSLGGLASLAGQFGVDVGGASGGSVLSGDNILLYFKSESLAREVLLSPFEKNSIKSVADVYSEVYDLKSKWEKNKNVGNVRFAPLNTSLSRLQDSLIQSIISNILKNQFFVSKTDKKAGFIEVSSTMRNEILSKVYCEKIVKVAIDRYINIKTQRQKATVDKLQSRVDSIADLLGKKTLTSASLQTTNSTMDINPLYRTGTSVAAETTIRDKTMLSTIFVSVVQNLELAKFTLSQETPVIQIVDSSELPLKTNKLSKLKSAIQVSLIFTFFAILIFTFKRILPSIY